MKVHKKRAAFVLLRSSKELKAFELEESPDPVRSESVCAQIKRTLFRVGAVYQEEP